MSQLRVVLSGSTALVKAGASKSRFTAAGLAASAALALSAQGAQAQQVIDLQTSDQTASFGAEVVGLTGLMAWLAAASR
ncbi:hypothetical protein [Brevundimonas sp. GN22]